MFKGRYYEFNTTKVVVERHSTAMSVERFTASSTSTCIARATAILCVQYREAAPFPKERAQRIDFLRQNLTLSLIDKIHHITLGTISQTVLTVQIFAKQDSQKKILIQ